MENTSEPIKQLLLASMILLPLLPSARTMCWESNGGSTSF